MNVFKEPRYQTRKEIIKKFQDKYQGRLVLIKEGLFKNNQTFFNLTGRIVNVVSIEFLGAKNKHFDLKTDELLVIKVLCKNKYYKLQNHMVGSTMLKKDDLDEEIERNIKKTFEVVDINLILRHEDLQENAIDATDIWLEKFIFPKGVENYVTSTEKNFGLAIGNVVRALDHKNSFPIEIEERSLVYPLAIKRHATTRKIVFLFYSNGNVYKYEFADPKKPFSLSTSTLNGLFKIQEFEDKLL